MAQTILVVDDDPVQRRLLETAISRSGMTVITAPGGQPALDLINGPRGEQIAHYFTHGLGLAGSIAALVILAVFAALRGDSRPRRPRHHHRRPHQAAPCRRAGRRGPGGRVGGGRPGGRVAGHRRHGGRARPARPDLPFRRRPLSEGGRG